MGVLATLVALVAASGSALFDGGACQAPESRALGPAATRTVICGAALPASGESFAGPVLHVFDGRSLCVALGPTPPRWIHVSLADAGGIDSRSALTAIVFGKRIVCVAVRVESDSVVAHCALDGVSLGREAIAATGNQAM